jgi:hypothetical protein
MFLGIVLAPLMASFDIELEVFQSPLSVRIRNALFVFLSPPPNFFFSFFRIGFTP